MIGKTNAGAGGGHLNDTDALLRVSAPAGSIVTITKGSTVKSDHGHENANDSAVYDYYFIIHQSQFDSENPWTVTATLGEESASNTVIIYLPDEYDVILSYALLIYNAGDQCSSITGGWNGNGTYTLDAGYINVPLSSGGAYANVYTKLKIDLTIYQTLYFEWEEGASFQTGTGGTEMTMWVAPSQISNNGVSYPSGATIQNQVGGDVRGYVTLGTRQLDVSNLSGEYYIGFHAGRGGGSGDDWYKAHLLKVYLEA